MNAPRRFGSVGLLAQCVLLFAGVTVRAETGNLLSNGDFEGKLLADGAPAGWLVYVPIGKADFRISSDLAHGGKHCLLLETPSDMKATLVSDPLPVAAGEKLTLSVWCRVEALRTTSSGTLTLNAGFLDGRRRYFRWVKGQPAPPPAGRWTQLRLDAEVPAAAAYVTFQIGHAQMTGRTQWDDAELRSASPVALRFANDDGQCEPGRQDLPLVLINREPARVGTTVELRTEPDRRRIQHKITKQAEERIAVTFDLLNRGKQRLKVVLADGDQVLATARRETTVPPLLVAEPLLPTHWCLEDGPPHIEGRAWVHEEAARREQLQLTCILVGGLKNDGPVLARTEFSALPANPVVFKLAPSAAKLGDYIVRLTLRDGNKDAAQAEQDWHIIHRAQAEVRVSPDGYLRVDGKPFFPIGMFNGSRFPEQAAAGFNVSHGYNAMTLGPGDAPNHQRVKDFLDNSQRAGMKTLMLVSHGLGTGRSLSDEIVRRVRIFRNHPGLLAWDEEEGVARGEAPVSYLKDLRAMLQREGPEHPLMIGDAYNVITKVDRSRLFPEEYMDLGMWWWYPFPLAQRPTPSASQPADALQGEEAAAGTELVPPTFLTLATTKKPIWLGVQAYRKPERRDGRFPTPTEYRAQAYVGIIHGAKGLMYYVGSGSGGNGILNKPQEGHWEDLKRIVTELREMAPVFMSPDSPATVTVSPAALISTRLKAADSGRVLLAANRSDQPVEVTLTVGGSLTGQRRVAVLHENRAVLAADGRFTDRFEGYVVHVYKLPED